MQYKFHDVDDSNNNNHVLQEIQFSIALVLILIILPCTM